MKHLKEEIWKKNCLCFRRFATEEGEKKELNGKEFKMVKR